MLNGLLALLLVLALGGAAAWWFFGRDRARPSLEARTTKHEARTIAAVAPQIVTNRVVEPTRRKVDEEKARLRAKLKTMTPEERKAFAIERMKNRPIDLTPTTNKPFRTGMEWQMAKLFMTPLGRRPIPLPPAIHISDAAHMEEILNASNPELEGDSDEVKDMKQVVQAAKEELRKYISEGGDYDSFMSYYYNKLEEAFRMRQEYSKMVLKVAKEEPDISKDFFNEANAKLAEKGIIPIKFTNWKMKQLGLNEPEGK